MSMYQGHRSWNAWNVALWISNDYDVYCEAINCLKSVDTMTKAVDLFFKNTGLHMKKTPDGAIYNRLSVREALLDLRT